MRSFSCTVLLVLPVNKQGIHFKDIEVATLHGIQASNVMAFSQHTRTPGATVLSHHFLFDYNAVTITAFVFRLHNPISRVLHTDNHSFETCLVIVPNDYPRLCFIHDARETTKCAFCKSLKSIQSLFCCSLSRLDETQSE